jgi:hypothetical protein
LDQRVKANLDIDQQPLLLLLLMMMMFIGTQALVTL